MDRQTGSRTSTFRSRAIIEREIEIGSHKYQIVSDDEYLERMGSIFEPHLVALFQSLIQKTFRVLDVGANIGCTSLLFGQLSQEVVSFEPSPSTFKFLSTNVKNSNHLNIEVKNFGLGAEKANLALTYAPNNRSGAFVSDKLQASAGHNIEEIEIRKGDDCVSNGLVHLIKIDVEGFEKEVLKGLHRTIEQDHPIVVLELNHWCLNAFQRITVPDFFDFLLGIFPILYAVDVDNYLDLHNASSRYIVMYEHINRFRFPNLVGAFSPIQLESFLAQFRFGQ